MGKKSKLNKSHINKNLGSQVCNIKSIKRITVNVTNIAHGLLGLLKYCGLLGLLNNDKESKIIYRNPLSLSTLALVSNEKYSQSTLSSRTLLSITYNK